MPAASDRAQLANVTIWHSITGLCIYIAFTTASSSRTQLLKMVWQTLLKCLKKIKKLWQKPTNQTETVEKNVTSVKSCHCPRALASTNAGLSGGGTTSGGTTSLSESLSTPSHFCFLTASRIPGSPGSPGVVTMGPCHHVSCPVREKKTQHKSWQLIHCNKNHLAPTSSYSRMVETKGPTTKEANFQLLLF